MKLEKQSSKGTILLMSDLGENIESSTENPFEIQPERAGFESLSNQNGFRFWWASDLMRLLGYCEFKIFEKAVQKAMSVCVEVGADLLENISATDRNMSGKLVRDYKLSRFACYLVAMNGDVKKREVALAQAYFAQFAQAIQHYLQQTEDIERLLIRGEISTKEKSLARAAKQGGVENYALFNNAGYRGLYNMDLGQLKKMKRVPTDRSPLDFMGREEYAANLFRITQTESKILNERIKGQKNLESAAENTGKIVRQAIGQMGGTMPENLQISGDIKAVKKGLKNTSKEFKKIDKAAPKKLQ